jgi:hypothetical protein
VFLLFILSAVRVAVKILEFHLLAYCGFAQFKAIEFMQHYHKRSNMKSTFSMLRAKFGGFIRSKLPAAKSMKCYARYFATIFVA